jgi:hypothetical protein
MNTTEGSIPMKGKTTTIIAITALVVACLAATPVGQAAGKFVLGKNSVGTKQLKKNAVTGVKVKNGSLWPPTSDRASSPPARKAR